LSRSFFFYHVQSLSEQLKLRSFGTTQVAKLWHNISLELPHVRNRHDPLQPLDKTEPWINDDRHYDAIQHATCRLLYEVDFMSFTKFPQAYQRRFEHPGDGYTATQHSIESLCEEYLHPAIDTLDRFATMPPVQALTLCVDGQWFTPALRRPAIWCTIYIKSGIKFQDVLEVADTVARCANREILSEDEPVAFSTVQCIVDTVGKSAESEDARPDQGDQRKWAVYLRGKYPVLGETRSG